MESLKIKKNESYISRKRRTHRRSQKVNDICLGFSIEAFNGIVKDPFFEESMTTYDVCEKIVKVRTLKPEKSSYATLLSNSPPTTTENFEMGIANCFVSHAWKYPFLVLLEAMRHDATKNPRVLYWLDICAINQHRTEELPESFWYVVVLFTDYIHVTKTPTLQQA